MSIIRAGGFTGALAIHGLLLAAVPQPQSINLSSGSISVDNIALSISYQHLSTVATISTNTVPTTYRSKELREASSEIEIIKTKKETTKTEASKAPVRTINNAQPTININRETFFSEIEPLSHTAVVEKKETKKLEADVLEDVPQLVSNISNTKTVTALEKSAVQGIHQNIITEPLFSSSPTPPKYPDIARKRGQQGTVWVDIMLDDKGRQKNAEIYKSSGVSPLDRAALKAVRQWEFIAHSINNIAVASHIRVPVEFSLE